MRVPALLGREGLLSVLPTRRLAVLLLLPLPLLLLGGGSAATAGAAAIADLLLLGLAALEAWRLPSRREVRVRADHLVGIDRLAAVQPLADVDEHRVGALLARAHGCVVSPPIRSASRSIARL